MGFLTLVVAVLLAAWIARAMWVRAGRSRSVRTAESPATKAAPQAAAASAASTSPTEAALSARLHETAEKGQQFFDDSALPADLLENPLFKSGVALLSDTSVPAERVVSYATGENAVIGCFAFEALRERKEGGTFVDTVIASFDEIRGWRLHFGLRYLAGVVPAGAPLVGRVVVRIAAEGWAEDRFAPQFLGEFLRQRLAGGESPTLGAHLQGLPGRARRSLGVLLKKLGPEAAPLREELEANRRVWVDEDLLKEVGSVWGADAAARAAIVEHDILLGAVDALETAYLANRPSSTLLIGESGVGKSAIARSLVTRMHRAGWVVFEAGPAQLLAGQVYIGEFEKRMQDLLGQLSRPRRVLWVIPDFPALALAGKHKYSQIGALDTILPYIEQGTITVLGECQPAAYERLLQERPRVATALRAQRVSPMSEADTLSLARQWMSRSGASAGVEALVREAGQLALQFLGHKGMPGSVLELLRLTRERLQSGPQPVDPGAAVAAPSMTPDDLIVTLSQMTGLPARILDDREALDLAALRRLFEERVKGQPDAVDCLVDRVAMIKAGVTDPTRPSGVFLFAGPTGTGKTAIAKALAEFLFGSPDRMIRLDMSEYQTPDSLDQILGTTHGEDQTSFADQVRRQPFSVVLLDEFEKAHERVWDIFLQVFDDGRLTDRRGRTADVRHAIIILTSNLGGAIPSGLGLGFSNEAEAFRAGTVTRTIEKTFRREFLNRIDRVVVFKPLNREVMRQILQRELAAALRRRGLRSRAWEVEWDESAVEFLLAMGFTPDLGARPLKRAIERYLLAPLATTIVNRTYPAGDQFLLVSRNADRLVMEFVDPEAPGPSSTPAIEASRPAGSTVDGLEAIALQPAGRREEIALLRHRLERLQEKVDGEAWKGAKARALEETSRPEFWVSSKRFEVLGAYEYRDRIESGVQRAGSLLSRLIGRNPAPRVQYPPALVGALAHNLYLLETACSDLDNNRPREAFLLVEARSVQGERDADSDRFAMDLAAMYRAWAEKRRMRFETLEESSESGRRYSMLAAVSGFGAHSILAPENGMHVLEQPDERPRQFERCRVQVTVVSQPSEPAGGGPMLKAQALRAMEHAGARTMRIVRRYRRDPSPLVRDAVRGYRTGRLDLVTGGDFDLIRGVAGTAEVGVDT